MSTTGPCDLALSELCIGSRRLPSEKQLVETIENVSRFRVNGTLILPGTRLATFSQSPEAKLGPKPQPKPLKLGPAA